MLLQLTRISTTYQLSSDDETKPVIEKSAMLLEQESIVRAYENPDGTTQVVIRYPYGGTLLGYEETDFTVEEPIKYLMSGKKIDRVKGKCPGE